MYDVIFSFLFGLAIGGLGGALLIGLCVAARRASDDIERW